MSTFRNLSAIPTSFGWLLRHRVMVLALALLWGILMVIAPLAQLRAGLPEHLLYTAVVNLIFTLPAEFYLLPMLLAYLDARYNHHPANLLQDWRHTFESRWLKAAVARAVLYIAVSAGLAFFIVPGLLIILLLGWMPYYALLRGGSVTHAGRWSVQVMAREWRRVLLAALPIFAIYLALLFGVDRAAAHWGPEPSLYFRFRHPVFWLVYVVSAVINIWSGMAFLALFHDVENELMLKAQDPDQRRK
nr:hypothetical protein [uncultured Holophaga sp.]